MAAKVRSTGRRTLSRSDVSKKKPQTGKGASQFSHQMNIRIPDDLYGRIEKTAAALGLDETNLVRMILNENLASYEHRADQIHGASKKCSTPHG